METLISCNLGNDLESKLTQDVYLVVLCTFWENFESIHAQM